jgi:hypothetical protein
MGTEDEEGKLIDDSGPTLIFLKARIFIFGAGSV